MISSKTLAGRKAYAAEMSEKLGIKVTPVDRTEDVVREAKRRGLGQQIPTDWFLQDIRD
jgi:hypothetical protein